MRHRVLSLPVALLIVVTIHLVCGWFASELRFNNSPEVYYTRGSPALALRDQLRRSFPNDEMLTIILHGKDLYSTAFLRRLDQLVSRLEGYGLVDRVSAVTSMERITATSDGFVIGKLIDVSKLKKESPEDLRRRVAANRFAMGTVASTDPDYLAVIVRPKLLTESSERLALKLAVAEAINATGMRPYYAGDAGPITMDIAQLQSILEDSAVFVPLTFALALGLMWWIVGRWRPVAIGAVAMSTVILPCLATIVIAGQPYTMATAILPSLLAAYTSATLLHLYAAIQRGHGLGLSRGRSVDHALGETLKPGAFNALTASSGLLSLLYVPIPPVQIFGAVGALGTVMVFITVYFLVPPFLRHWDSRRWPTRESGLGRFGRVAPKLAIFSMRHPKAVVIVAVLLTASLLPMALRVEAESDLLAFFKQGHPVSMHTRLVESKLSGVTPLEISIVATDQDDLQSVAMLRQIKQLQQWLEKQPQVDRAYSMVDVVEEMHSAMNAQKPGFRAIPATDRLLRQYLLVYDGRDLFELVDRDFRRARIVLSLNVHGSRGIGETIAHIRGHIKSEPLPGLEIEVGGYGRMFADQSDLLISGQINSFAGAFLQIFVIMLVLWRSFGAAALCMVPNLAPLYFVFVMMGLLGIYIDTATVMIASLVLGITVDDTIHLYHSYKARLAEGGAPVFAIARSFASNGSAVLAISALLVSQFLLLATSSFIPTANFGLMTAVGLLSGQVFELILLPALLLLKDGNRKVLAGPPGNSAVSSSIGEPTATHR